MLAVIALPGWMLAHKRVHEIADLPLQKIRSAAQGRVAVVGRASPLAGGQTVDPVSGLPCLWYHVSVVRGRGDDQERYAYGSDESFLLEDGSGHCLIDPEGAQVVAPSETLIRGDERITHSAILTGDTLFVVGRFCTLTSDALRPEPELAREVIADWKLDKAALHTRFDLDGNGEIDQKEWQLARTAALREARQRRSEAAREPEIHAIGLDASGSLLISTRPRPRLLRKLRLQRAFWGLIFIAGCALIGWGTSPR